MMDYEHGLNIFKLPDKGPMIYSYESAKEFMEQCKYGPFTIYAKGVGYIEVTKDSFRIYVKRRDIVEFEKLGYYHRLAVKWLYKYRKYINAHFRGE